jgi:toxin YoeB
VKLVFSARAWNDYQHWVAADAQIFERLNTLIRECRRSPFTGIGKPEPLKGELKGWWSRRLTLEDRIIYRVRGAGEDQHLEIAQCRFHY